MDISLVGLLLNFGLGGVIIFCLATGILVPGFIYKEKKDDNEKLTDALAVERERNLGLQQVAATGAKALDAITQVAEERRQEREAAQARAALPPAANGGGPS